MEEKERINISELVEAYEEAKAQHETGRETTRLSGISQGTADWVRLKKLIKLINDNWDKIKSETKDERELKDIKALEKIDNKVEELLIQGRDTKLDKIKKEEFNGLVDYADDSIRFQTFELTVIDENGFDVICPFSMSGPKLRVCNIICGAYEEEDGYPICKRLGGDKLLANQKVKNSKDRLCKMKG